MSKKLKLMHKLVDARKRLRDVASASLAAAENDRLSALIRTEDAQSERRTLLDEAAARLQAARSVDDLVRFEAERALAEHIVHHREQELARSAEIAEARRVVLNEKTRSMRTSERILEREKKLIAGEERKDEQKSSDDLASTKFTRSR